MNVRDLRIRFHPCESKDDTGAYLEPWRDTNKFRLKEITREFNPYHL